MAHATRPPTVDRDSFESRSLARASPGRSYRVTGVFFSMVRDRCADFDCREGDTLLCLENAADGLLLRRSNGARMRLEREYAWFVQVIDVSEPVIASRGATRARAGIPAR